MGHYASEMSAPVRHEPEVLTKRRAEERDRAEFAWNLHAQYEAQGEWIRSDERLVCPKCYALIPAVLRQDHDGWHEAATR